MIMMPYGWPWPIAAAHRPGRLLAPHRLVGAEYCVTSCDLGVFMDQAAEAVSAQDAQTGHVARWVRAPAGRVLLQRPVRPMDVVVAGVLAQDKPQVPFAGDQHPVQAFTADTSDPALRDRVAPRRQLHPIRTIGTDASG